MRVLLIFVFICLGICSQDYQQLLVDNFQDVHLLYNAGVQVAHEGDVAQAKNYFKQALEHKAGLSNSEQKKLLYNLGNTHATLKEYEEALKIFEMIEAEFPCDPQVTSKIEYLKKLLEQKDEQKDQSNEPKNNDKNKNDQDQSKSDNSPQQENKEGNQKENKNSGSEENRKQESQDQQRDKNQSADQNRNDSGEQKRDTEQQEQEQPNNAQEPNNQKAQEQNVSQESKKNHDQAPTESTQAPQPTAREEYMISALEALDKEYQKQMMVAKTRGNSKQLKNQW